MALPNPRPPKKEPTPSADTRSEQKPVEETRQGGNDSGREQNEPKRKRVKQWLKQKAKLIIWSDRLCRSLKNWRERLENEIPVEDIPVEDIPVEELIELLKDLIIGAL